MIKLNDLDPLKKQFDELSAKNLKIDMTRGKPCAEQLELSKDLLKFDVPLFGVDKLDFRNYGLLEGITEARELFAELMQENPKNVLVIGSSSLTLMHDCIQRSMQFGVGGHPSFNEQSKTKKIKFLCPVPGYDRHFKICENFGIEMINVSLLEDGPDMDQVELLVENDDSVKGIWCVPQYSNPSGITYSDKVVKRLASMKCAAPDFRIYWDNAYCVHHLYEENNQEHVLDIAKTCEEAGNEDRYFKFASLSKVTFPGASIAAMAMSEANLNHAKKHLSAQMIGSDKINQIRHVLFFKNANGIKNHMRKHAEILRPKFETVEEKLQAGFSGFENVNWSKPKGGYFISFNAPKGTAKRVVEIANDLGVKFTQAGATYPLGNDPNDENIRIAPSMPSIDELKIAIDVLVLATKIAANEKKE